MFRGLENDPFSVLVFGPEWVSYERSRGIRRWVLREISARAFLYFPKKNKNVKKTQNWEKNKISMFRENAKNIKLLRKHSQVNLAELWIAKKI